jgi:SNF2 family DNA or RNA helicase
MSLDVQITADVKVLDHVDRLIIAPRERGLMTRTSGLIQEALPGITVHRNSEGLWITALEAPRLLSADIGLDLRWTDEARLVAANRQRALEYHPQLKQEVDKLCASNTSLAENYIRDLVGVDRLDAHQRVNVAAMTLPGGFGLSVFDEQGAGKTVTAIFGFDLLVERDEVDFALIVAPKSMVPEWPRDFTRFKGDLYKTAIVAGTPRQKRASIASGADVLITNFETAISMEAELRACLRWHGGRAVIIIDESFYVKNLDAQRTKALKRLREWCRRAFILCGTPAPNSPHDLVQQFNLVDFGITFAGVEIPKDRSEALPVVQEAIESRGIYTRHLKSDVLPDLPGKTFHRLIVPMAEKQQRLYEGALRDFILNLQATDDEGFHKQITSFLARRSALLQICSSPAALSEGYDETPAKLAALDGILAELIERKGEKVVLWSFYTATINTLIDRYQRYNPVRYDGMVTDVAARREGVRCFQEDDHTMLFIANPAAAGAGLTLHRARFAVYESMSNQAAHYLQSLDRIHRRGQEREVEYLILLCDGSIELQEYETLTRKEKSAQALLGDHVTPPITRETLLAEALRAQDALRGDP